MWHVAKIKKKVKSKPVTLVYTFDLTGYTVAFEKSVWIVLLHTHRHTHAHIQVRALRSEGLWQSKKGWCSALRRSWLCQAVSRHPDAGSTTSLGDTLAVTYTHSTQSPGAVGLLWDLLCIVTLLTSVCPVTVWMSRRDRIKQTKKTITDLH